MEPDGEMPIACDLDALDPTERRRRAELAGSIVSQVSHARETTHGYELVIDAPADISRDVIEWFLLEKRCCPFLRFGLMLGSGDSELRIELSGGVGVKEFLASQGLAQNVAVSR